MGGGEEGSWRLEAEQGCSGWCAGRRRGRSWSAGGASAPAQGGCCCSEVAPHLGNLARSVGTSGRGTAVQGTSPGRTVGNSGGARRSPTCGGGASRSETSSARRPPFGLKDFMGSDKQVVS